MDTREKLLSAKNTLHTAKPHTIKIGDDSITVEIRCPTVGQRNRWLVLEDTTEGSRQSALLVQAVMDCVYDPTKRAPMFIEADRASLLEQPANSWVDELGTAVLAFMNDNTGAGAKKD